MVAVIGLLFCLLRCSFFVTGPGTALLTNERMVRGRKGPGYPERKFQGTNSPQRESLQGLFLLRIENSRERTVQGTNYSKNESSIMGTNVTGKE